MKFKKNQFIAIGILVLCMLFYGVFILGARYGRDIATPAVAKYMHEQSMSFMAARFASNTLKLHEVLIKYPTEKNIVCILRKAVLDRVDDWETCKNNTSCTEKIRGGLFDQTDSKVADFKAVTGC
jgi:hypothetical protein